MLPSWPNQIILHLVDERIYLALAPAGSLCQLSRNLLRSLSVFQFILNCLSKFFLCPFFISFFLPPLNHQRKLPPRRPRLEILQCSAYVPTPVFLEHLGHLARDANAAVSQDRKHIFQSLDNAIRRFEKHQRIWLAFNFLQSFVTLTRLMWKITEIKE